MICPHCRLSIHESWTSSYVKNDDSIGNLAPNSEALVRVRIYHMRCPGCSSAIVRAVITTNDDTWSEAVFPRGSSRARATAEAPTSIQEDFNDACLVLGDSPKASAALSRRCLQAVLRDRGYLQKDLAGQIDAAIQSGKLPDELADNLDAVRNNGNFAAHPIKSTSSGEIVEVEPHEADWNLDVLEGCFDFFYDQPARAKARRDALNKKLSDAGKPPMKGRAPP